jgi:ribosomal protein S18 acetylase RimI-like enzyme
VNLVLVQMSPEEFDVRSAALRERYANNLQTRRGMTVEAAQAEAVSQMQTVLPEGTRTDKAILRTAEVDGVPVGWVWVMLPGAVGHPEMAWLHNIDVDAEHQGKGYGRAVMRAVEAELEQLGVERLGLNVFGHNTRAIRLYESLGFEVMTQQMSKSVGG